MGVTSLVITILIITILIIGIATVFYVFVTLRKINKISDKFSFLLEDFTHKSEQLNPPIESLKKLFNYIDAFDFLVKNNVKSGLSLFRRNSYISYKLIQNLKNLLGDSEDFKTTKRKKK